MQDMKDRKHKLTHRGNCNEWHAPKVPCFKGFLEVGVRVIFSYSEKNCENLQLLWVMKFDLKAYLQYHNFHVSA